MFGGTGQPVLQDGSNISNTAINLLRQTEKIQQVKGGFNNGYYIPSLRYNASGVPFCVGQRVMRCAHNTFASHDRQ